MVDIKKSLEKQIEVLEKIQQNAMKESDTQKALEISQSIVSISYTINNLE